MKQPTPMVSTFAGMLALFSTISSPLFDSDRHVGDVSRRFPLEVRLPSTKDSEVPCTLNIDSGPEPNVSADQSRHLSTLFRRGGAASSTPQYEVSFPQTAAAAVSSTDAVSEGTKRACSYSWTLGSELAVDDADCHDSANDHGIVNVRAYGSISGSTQHATGSIKATTLDTITLSSAIDFAKGQGVAIAHAGSPPLAAAPSAPKVFANCRSSCTRTYQYKVVALDGNGGVSASSLPSAANNNVVLTNGSNYNTIKLAPRAGDESYAVYRLGSKGVLGLVPNTSGLGTVLTFVDYGQAPIAGIPTIPDIPPSLKEADTLITSIGNIVSRKGLTELKLTTLAKTPVASEAIFHDDSIAFQAAVNALSGAKAGTILVPTGAYIISFPIRAWGFHGLHYVGAGKEIDSSGGGSRIYASRMLAGLPVFFFGNSQQSGVERLSIYGSASGPAISAIESRAARPAVQFPHGLLLRDLTLNGEWDNGNGGFVEGILYSADPDSDDNNDESYIENVDIYETSDACLFIGHPQSLYHTIVAGNWALCPTGVKQYGGSFSMHGTAITASDAQFHAFAGSYPDPGETITGVNTEAPSPITSATPARLLVIDADAHNAYFDFQGYRFEWSSPGISINTIDLEAADATASFSSCTINAQGAQNLNILEANSNETLRIVNSEISVNEINYYGRLDLFGNHSANRKAANLIAHGNRYVLVDSGGDIGTFHNSGTLLANRGFYLQPRVAGNIAGFTTFDFKVANVIEVTLTGTVRLTMENTEPAYSSGEEVSVKLCQDSKGNHALVWPVNIKWSGGIAPPNGMTQTPSKCDWFGFKYDGNRSTGGSDTFWNLWKSQDL